MALQGQDGIFRSLVVLKEVSAPARKVANAFTAFVGADGIKTLSRHLLLAADDTISLSLKRKDGLSFGDIVSKWCVVERQIMDSPWLA